MSVLVEAGRGPWRWLFQRVANPALYQPLNEQSYAVLVFIRGVRSDDLFASAMQQDVAGIMDATAFAATFPARPRPARYDRLRTATTSFTVEEWRGSPNDDSPVFFKCLLRGGSQ